MATSLAIRKEAVAVFQGSVIVATALAAFVAVLADSFGSVAPWLVTANVIVSGAAAFLTRANVFSQATHETELAAASAARAGTSTPTV